MWNRTLVSTILVLALTLGGTAHAQELRGWVDLHAHPMAHLAFGGKLIHGAPDIDSLLPADSRCQHKVRATSMEHALGTDNSTHGGSDFLANPCGDDIRKQVIDTLQSENGASVTPDWARGAEDFAHWPRWNEITHQKMWVDWIRRAHRGGLRVMVGLATHNRTLAQALSGPGDGPIDDKASADLQIAEMKAFVYRHGDFMDIAETPAQLRRIVRDGKLAVVLGVEIDAIGNFHADRTYSDDVVKAEIRRLYEEGVRYIFPVHVVDNTLGGTAAYEKSFNTSNYHLTGTFWDLACSAPGENVGFEYEVDGFDLAVAFVKAVKLGIDFARNPPTPPECGPGQGHLNRRRLTSQGEAALEEMMRLGMLIDIDHMSQATANSTIGLAEEVPGGYPLSSGHNRYRTSGRSENARTDDQIRRITSLGGMFGVGSAGLRADEFVRELEQIASRTGYRNVGLGTDLNGLVKGPRPRPGAIVYNASYPRSRTGTRVWDYNLDGVAHYGLLNEFVKDVSDLGGERIEDTLWRSAEDFASMWERAEAQKARVGTNTLIFPDLVPGVTIDPNLVRPVPWLDLERDGALLTDTATSNLPESLGCYRDAWDRDLNGHHERRSDLTPLVCVEICASRGFPFAGVQFARQCFCGDGYGKHGPADNCDMACTGDDTKTCGGTWANEVYRTGRTGAREK